MGEERVLSRIHVGDSAGLSARQVNEVQVRRAELQIVVEPRCARIGVAEIPRVGFQDVMERPDSVSRVMPPTTTMSSTKAASE